MNKPIQFLSQTLAVVVYGFLILLLVGLLTPLSRLVKDPSFYHFFVALVDVYLVLYFAVLVSKMENAFNIIKQKFKELQQLQSAFKRNAEIAEKTDRLNGTYHNKIYRSVVSEIGKITTE